MPVRGGEGIFFQTSKPCQGNRLSLRAPEARPASLASILPPADPIGAAARVKRPFRSGRGGKGDGAGGCSTGTPRPGSGSDPRPPFYPGSAIESATRDKRRGLFQRGGAVTPPTVQSSRGGVAVPESRRAGVGVARSSERSEMGRGRRVAIGCALACVRAGSRLLPPCHVRAAPAAEPVRAAVGAAASCAGECGRGRPPPRGAGGEVRAVETLPEGLRGCGDPLPPPLRD